mmetsp:Transcript_30935/g.62801  ORF Transcript_30935/g.62801 Transcript_30935/m.62801 type:complete len:117 (+) Transcript_30935:2-352(+)
MKAVLSLLLVAFGAIADAYVMGGGMSMSLAPSTVKVQRGQLERILKEKTSIQAALKNDIPALRAKIAELDYELVLSDLAAAKASIKAPEMPKKVEPATQSKGSSDPFAFFKNLFKM